MKNILKLINLTIKNKIGKQILSNLNLTLNFGEILILLGSNGSGKSTLANVLIRNEDFLILSGDVIYNNLSIINFNSLKISSLGLFLAFQYPIEIFGIIYIHFLKLISDKSKKYFKNLDKNKDIIIRSFVFKLKILLKIFNLKTNMLYRQINVGFSGGERKIFEFIQMIILEPKLCILDELDSGLDISIILLISKIILCFSNSKRSFIIITHNPKIVDLIKPNSVYILHNDKIIGSSKKLMKKLKKFGYSKI